jgi:multiple sugar transport system ATP-binding protein
MAEIICEGLGKRFRDGTVAVHDFDLEIVDGRFVILVGPSGCGKTTVLRMLAGLEDITWGELLIDGVRANDLEPRKRDIAMVFQSYALYPHMNVAKNMGFSLRRAGMPKQQVQAKVRETAAMLGIEELLARKPSQLSGGQRQRVAMGRAIVREPKAFLMDEPLSNLDAKLRVQMRTEITRIQRRLGATTVYVTHDQTEAMTLGDEIVVMRDGVIQQRGTPEDVYTRPQNVFVAGFIGAPSMNLITGRVGHGVLATPIGEIPIAPEHRNTLEGRDGVVIVGIRPEDFADAELVGAHRGGHTLTATIDVLEDTGSDVFAHISLGSHGGGLAPPPDSDEPVPALASPPEREGSAPVLAPAPDAGEDAPVLALPAEAEETAPVLAPDIVARLEASTRLKEGSRARLWLDPARLHLFDPASGERLRAQG